MTSIPMALIVVFAVATCQAPLHLQAGRWTAGLAVTATALAAMAGVIATRGMFHV